MFERKQPKLRNTPSNMNVLEKVILWKLPNPNLYQSPYLFLVSKGYITTRIAHSNVMLQKCVVYESLLKSMHFRNLELTRSSIIGT